MDRLNSRSLLLAFHYTEEEVKAMKPSAISQRAFTIAKANGLPTYTVPGRAGHWYDSKEVNKAAKGRAIPAAA